MYWSKQEQVVFDIVLFVLVVFQIGTFLNLNAGISVSGVFFVGLNVLLFMLMVPYAKWVWRTASYGAALLHVVKHEIVLLSLTILGIILTELITSARIST